MMDLLANSLVLRLVVLAIVFLVAVAAVMGTASLVTHRRAARLQLERIGEEANTESSATTLRTQANEGAWARLAATLEQAGLDLADTKSERLTKRLRDAGYKSPYAPKVFTLARIAMLFALPVVYLLIANLAGKPPSFLTGYVVSAFLALIGLYAPNLFVSIVAGRRRDEISRGFPDCLDLLIVCVESGLGVEAAMDRVGREMVQSHPLVAELLSATTLQLRAGASREDAFRKLGELAGVDEIRSFATLLIQSDKLGASITKTLRVYAAEMREKRSLRAEEKAHRLPVLISIPLVVCMLPVMIGVMMLPAVIRIVRDILPVLTGG